MPQFKTIIDLLIDELAEIRHLENQFFSILPQMLNAATDPTLRLALESNYHQLQNFIAAFDKTTAALKLPSVPCSGHVIRLSLGDNLQLLDGCSKYAADAALISIALKMEHYLNAAYLNACIHARMLTLDEISDLLQSRLKNNCSLFNRSDDAVTMFLPVAEDPEESVSPIANVALTV